MPVQSFGGAHRGRVCVRVFIGVSVRACCERLHCTVLKKYDKHYHLKKQAGGIDEITRQI